MTKSMIEDQIFNFITLYSNQVFRASLKSSKENIDSHLRISFQFFFFFFSERDFPIISVPFVIASCINEISVLKDL